MGKKKTDSHKNTKDSKKANHKLSPAKLEELESLFFTGGITSYSAAKQVGIAPATASIYFEEWAEKLVEDEDHISWTVKEKYAKARYKEALTKRLIKIKSRLTYFENRLTHVITTKDENEKRIPNYNADESKVDKAERLVRLTEIQYNDIQQEYAIIDMMPPSEVILQKEVERLINEKQSAFGN